MERERLFETCYKERIQSLEHVQIGWVKMNAFDLMIKYFIFIINSIGSSKSAKADYLFVDEVKNNNMSNNLLTTKDIFDKKKEKTAMLSFYKINRKNSLKFGYLRPIAEAAYIALGAVPVIVLAAMGRRRDRNVIRMIGSSFERLLPKIRDVTEIYLMSDHHFYSTMIAVTMSDKCSVLQHGLIMDKRFYYPIRAGRFMAWGERSWQLEYDDPKVIVTGTYKYLGIKSNNTTPKQKTLLFCIGSLDNEKVKQKIDVLFKLTKRNNYCLKIKCHPGSLFNIEQWKELYKNKEIVFYKEELVQTLAFDIAVSENSTVIMDLIAMHKPFVIFDDINGYYSKYANIIPHGNDLVSISEMIEKIDSIDFVKIADTLNQQELNNGICSIYENRRK